VKEAGQGHVKDAGQGYVKDAGQGYVKEAGQGYVKDAGQGHVKDAGQGYVKEAGQGYVSPFPIRLSGAHRDNFAFLLYRALSTFSDPRILLGICSQSRNNSRYCD
jgi:hypothetical protein